MVLVNNQAILFVFRACNPRCAVSGKAKRTHSNRYSMVTYMPLEAATMNAGVDRNVRMAARALAGAQLVHAYGHCSARIDERHFLVCAAKPMGTILPGEPGTVVPIDGPLPEGVLGEVRIHQAIYRRRSVVGAVCRIMPPQTGLLALLRRTPRPRHGFGAYFAPAPPFWDDPRLLRDDAAAERLAAAMGRSNAIVMRANGAVVAGVDLVEAVALSWFLEEAARVEVGLMQLKADGEDTLLSLDEVSARQVTAGRVYERMWEHLTHGDPEAGRS